MARCASAARDVWSGEICFKARRRARAGASARGRVWSSMPIGACLVLAPSPSPALSPPKAHCRRFFRAVQCAAGGSRPPQMPAPSPAE
eukprot:366191-Chlamydomonas_euryale.AAC.10